jgi:hypothetical protein
VANVKLSSICNTWACERDSHPNIYDDADAAGKNLVMLTGMFGRISRKL